MNAVLEDYRENLVKLRINLMNNSESQHFTNLQQRYILFGCGISKLIATVIFGNHKWEYESPDFFYAIPNDVGIDGILEKSSDDKLIQYRLNFSGTPLDGMYYYKAIKPLYGIIPHAPMVFRNPSLIPTPYIMDGHLHISQAQFDQIQEGQWK